MNEREADLIAARAHLKTMCDPRGHGLIDALVDAALDTYRVARVFACEPDESCGMADEYPLDDPKSNGFHDRLVSLWDSREGK